MRIAIVGGGISGLATAFYVKRLAPEADVTLLEAAPRLGGTMVTHDIEGFRFEGGSNGFLSNKPWTLDFVKDAGGEGLLVHSNDAARVRYIYSNALHRLPESPPAFLATPLISWGAKLRVLGEVFTPARRDISDETLQSFGYRRVGREFTDTFLDPMSAGIFASTPARLSVNAAFPAVVRLEQQYGGLFRGMLKRRKRSAGPGGVLMSFRGGVGGFIEHMAGVLGESVRTGVAVNGLTRSGAVYRLATAQILVEIDPVAAGWLAQIEYSPISVVGFGYRQLAHELPGFGLLTTSSAGLDILGVLWDSSIFPDRAPPGGKALRVMIGGQRSPALALESEERLIEIAREGVRKTMGLDDAPAVTFVQRWPQGIPNYPVGHLANADRLFARVADHPGLYLNSNAYYGIGLNDCVGNSRLCAEKVVAGEPWRGGPLLPP
jgi:oxygen-dependent protoporphyrinogen oxidase